jgi:hypothetical protein
MHFSGVENLLSYLREEQKVKDRFATRFIMIQGQKTWEELMSKLYYEVDETILLSTLCSGPDIFPDTEKIYNTLKSIDSYEKNIVICPIAECARLYNDEGEIIRYLAEWSSGKVNRIYVPMLAAGDIFDNQLTKIMRYKAGILPESWTVTGEGYVEVTVAPFHGTRAWDSHVVTGIKEYLELWEQGGTRKIWLKTRWASDMTVQQIRGDFRVRLFTSGYHFVRENSSWENLRQEWGNPSQWEWLASKMKDGENFDKLAGRLIDVTEYKPSRIMALWKTLDEDMRWLVWLWHKKKAKAGSYLYHVMQNSSSVDSFAHDVISGIFSIKPSVKIIEERKDLLIFLEIKHMSSNFWDRYDSLASDMDKLSTLTDISEEERHSIVKCLQNILYSKVKEVLWREQLECIYPMLAWYLMSFDFQDEFLTEYFRLYIRCRVMDQLSDELLSKAREGAEKQLIWNYPTRKDILVNINSKTSKIIWVDGLGLEWVGLITQLLIAYSNFEIDVKVARSNLPTTTEANKGWLENDEVLRGLDNIAHNYDYKFPNSLIEAFEVVKKIVDRIIALSQRYDEVILTADHGLSRFANKAGKVEVPAGMEVRDYGRYASFSTTQYQPAHFSGWIIDESKAIMLTHEKFSGGGASLGEVHGGGTLEECLVPVITITKPEQVITTYELISDTVKLNPLGNGELVVKCNRTIPNMQFKVAGQWLKCEKLDNNMWRVFLLDFTSGKYVGRVYCNYRFIKAFNFSVIKGLVEDDLGL